MPRLHRHTPPPAVGPGLFVTHAHEDTEAANETKEALRTIGFAGFVAHQDIEPTREWEDEILRNLRTCVGLVVVSTSYGRSSAWVNQEIGFAVGRGVPVIAVDRGSPPWGMLYRFQSLRWKVAGAEIDSLDARKYNIPKLYRALENVGIGTRDLLIEGIGQSDSFEEARVTATLLAGQGELRRDQAVRLATLSAENVNIRNCYVAQSKLPPLLVPFREHIPPKIREILNSSRMGLD